MLISILLFLQLSFSSKSFPFQPSTVVHREILKNGLKLKSETMFSERLYAMIAVYASIISYFGVAPMAWCKASRKTIPSRTALKKAYFNTFLITLLVIFSITQLIRFHIARDYDSFNVVLIFGLGNFLCFETFVMMTSQENDTRIAVNGLLSYLRHMNSKF